jgi:Xaa-Pro aminopeptidase
MDARRLACTLAACIAVAPARSATPTNATAATAVSHGVPRQPGSDRATARAASTPDPATPDSVLRERRHRAAQLFRDGIILLRANRNFDIASDGFRQGGSFFYFTGLANTSGALLAIDGRSGDSWLFLEPDPPLRRAGLTPEAVPDAGAASRLGIEHVVDWAALASFLSDRAGGQLYYEALGAPEMPPTLENKAAPDAPLWLQVILSRWSFTTKNAATQIDSLMAIQSADEQRALRSAATATVAALKAGMRAIRPGIHQRAVEAVVENACWTAGAHGPAFWPWAMAGTNAIMPRPFVSLGLYDHLDTVMQPGELVRLDVGCEWDHYGGDLGRTVPVSGHYTDAQRETWTVFVAAYQAGARTLRAGVSVGDVFDAWRTELLRHRDSVRTPLAQHAIDAWSSRDNVPFWQIHTTNLRAGRAYSPLRAGTTINFEPIAAVDGHAFFLEDMYLITPTGAELLTPGVPYTAADLEGAMR